MVYAGYMGQPINALIADPSLESFLKHLSLLSSPGYTCPANSEDSALPGYLHPGQGKWELEFRERRETASGLNLAGLAALVQALAWVDSPILPHFGPLFHTKAQNASLPCRAFSMQAFPTCGSQPFLLGLLAPGFSVWSKSSACQTWPQFPYLWALFSLHQIGGLWGPCLALLEPSGPFQEG